MTVYRYADTVAVYLAESVELARIDLWRGSPPPLIICESRTFGGVLGRTLAPEYLCPITATNGQVGGFLRTNVAPVLEDERTTVLDVGDLDLRGADIEANTRRVLEDALGRSLTLEWTRVALTWEQVEEYDLPVKVKDDAGKGAHEAVEVEALGQGTVTAIVRAALDALLPEPLADVQERQAEERREARKYLMAWDGA